MGFALLAAGAFAAAFLYSRHRRRRLLRRQGCVAAHDRQEARGAVVLRAGSSEASAAVAATEHSGEDAESRQPWSTGRDGGPRGEPCEAQLPSSGAEVLSDDRGSEPGRQASASVLLHGGPPPDTNGLNGELDDKRQSDGRPGKPLMVKMAALPGERPGHVAGPQAAGRPVLDGEERRAPMHDAAEAWCSSSDDGPVQRKSQRARQHATRRKSCSGMRIHGLTEDNAQKSSLPLLQVPDPALVGANSEQATSPVTVFEGPPDPAASDIDSGSEPGASRAASPAEALRGEAVSLEGPQSHHQQTEQQLGWLRKSASSEPLEQHTSTQAGNGACGITTKSRPSSAPLLIKRATSRHRIAAQLSGLASLLEVDDPDEPAKGSANSPMIAYLPRPCSSASLLEELGRS
eukprot:SM000112S23974  [mRNA]  locus=s112:144516:146000:+ [translate_table: standard]